MPEIACGHCGATHGSVAEVRDCSALDTSPDPVGEYFDDPVAIPPKSIQADPAQPVSGPPTTAGPEVIGRTLVVSGAQEPPPPWDAAPRFTIDEDVLTAPVEVANQLGALWAGRERYVVHISDDFTTPPATVLDQEAWRLGPDVDLPIERLLHAVWSNAAWLQADGSLTLPIATAAIELGAIAEISVADVRLPDGTDAWIDGGPIDLTLARFLTEAVLPTVTIEGHSLEPITGTDPTADLAPDQLLAVAHKGGPARIIAPAGSGKTRVLTERARHLLAGQNIPPAVITLVAFNKRAQLEMEERTLDLAGLRVRTLNALALAIVNGTDRFVRSATITTRQQTISERDVRDLLRRLVEVPRRANTDPLASWIEALGAARLGLRDPAQVEEDFGGDVAGFAEVLPRYREELARQNLVDYDEQILRAIELLLNDPHSRCQAQSTCRLLLVDEFQDLTPAHMMLIRLLAGPRNDVFGVGDDDQTIYGFTGASPAWLVDYQLWFPHAINHALEINYRCSPAVVTGARLLLERNKQRVDKSIRSAPDRQDDPAGLDLITTDTPLEAVTSRVEELLDSGAKATDIVILARVNVALAAPQVSLLQAGAEVCTVITPDLLQRTGVRALLAWLRLGVDPGSVRPADISEASRRPSRGLSRRVQEWMGEHNSVSDLRKLARRLESRYQTKIDDFLDDVENLADYIAGGASTSEAVRHVGEETGLTGALSALDSARRNVDRSTHLDDLDAIIQLGGLQPDPTHFDGWLHEQLQRTGAEPGGGVQLSTIHRVKGLEWPHVIVVGANNGTLPHRMADREEERRVFHVAMTRSSITTTIIADSGRPSIFLAEAEGTATEPDPGKQSNRSSRSLVRTEATPIPRGGGHLMDELKEWRLGWARSEDIPAYRIFSDSTLSEMALRLPTTHRELARVKGVGPKKLEAYGDELIEIISASTAK